MDSIRTRRFRCAAAFVVALALAGCAPHPAFLQVSQSGPDSWGVTFDEDRVVMLLRAGDVRFAKLTFDELSRLSALLDDPSFASDLERFRTGDDREERWRRLGRLARGLLGGGHAGYGAAAAQKPSVRIHRGHAQYTIPVESLPGTAPVVRDVLVFVDSAMSRYFGVAT